MASSLAKKARGRAIDVAGAVREALSAADTNRALGRAIGALEREAKGVRNWRPGDAMLIDARHAGEIAAHAALLHAHIPARPPGCPPVPRPEDLLAVFEAAYEKTINEALNGGGRS
jgi:hypothetical protein